MYARTHTHAQSTECRERPNESDVPIRSEHAFWPRLNINRSISQSVNLFIVYRNNIAR